MSLSDYASWSRTFGVKHGQDLMTAGEPETVFEIYKTWMYIREPKDPHNVLITLHHGDINFRNVSVYSKKADSQDAFFVYCSDSKSEAKMLGIGCYGDGFLGINEKTTQEFLSWAYSLSKYSSDKKWIDEALDIPMFQETRMGPPRRGYQCLYDYNFQLMARAYELFCFWRRDGDSFTCKVYDLMQKADKDNIRCLALAFPVEHEILQLWRLASSEDSFHKAMKEVLTPGTLRKEEEAKL